MKMVIMLGGYLDFDKRNITALKLRGEKSDGLVLPIEVLSKYVDVKTLYQMVIKFLY